MTKGRTTASSQVDLTNCDREPIHVLGHVQRFGCLISASSDWIVNHASENVADFFKAEADSLIGRPLDELFRAAAFDEIRDRLRHLDGPDAVERVFGLRLLRSEERLFDVAVHRSAGSIVLELERHDETQRADYPSFLRPMIRGIEASGSVAELCEAAAEDVRTLTGFDRVMVYRFAPDGSGEVVAESRRNDLEPYLGLRYPASDIPQQARALYRRNLLRIISDVDEQPSPIVPSANAHGEPLDLSLSSLRAVSSIHIEYLRNMKVRASLSISILKRGKLWGLFACHHMAPRVLSYETRTAAELFGQLFGFVLEQTESEAARKRLEHGRTLHDKLMAEIAGRGSLKDHVAAISDALASLVPCDGVVGWVDGEYASSGATPSREQFMELARFLNTAGASRIYTTDRLAAVHPPAAAYADIASGVLALPISRSPRDYIVLFRQELAKMVTWAGDPEKPVEVGPHGDRLTPRKSFETWREIVRGCSSAWTAEEVSAAEALRVTLLEVVLRMSEETSRDRARILERQEILIAELNHRVRNILSLIRGLVTQSRSQTKSVGEFVETVGGRIAALARAHDQITKERWSPASLFSLIDTEVQAYLHEKKPRVEVSGVDALLKPNAFSTLCLVIHELVTNSAKYGALSDSRGRIEIEVSETADGGMSLSWRESGGPKVETPLHRGFGSTIINRSAPHELDGSTEVRFEPSGLEVDIAIPSRHIARFVSREEQQATRPSPKPAGPASLLSGVALVVEDNMVIALDAELGLMDLGADRVVIESTAAGALAALDGERVSFALLDVSLADGTSEPVAERLSQDGTPFVFATGYGDASALSKSFPEAGVVQKPFTLEHLRAAIAARLKGKAV